MAYFLDILIVVVLLLSIWLGARRGFVYTLCSLLAVVVAFIGARILADALAPVVAGFLKPLLAETIQEMLEEQARNFGNSWDLLDVDQILAAVKEREGIFTWAAEQLERELASAPNLLPTAASLAADIAAAIAAKVAHSILFSVGFVVILLAWKLLTRTLDLVAKLPVLHSFNAGLGAMLGAVKGLIFVYLFAWLSTLTGMIPSELLAETVLLRFLAAYSPLDLLLSIS